ncbi:MAG: hypothetical protein JWL70_1562 [Acidimicrobiia bacterium]|nr:hypothetical protein [Acidimicrobiia bacterium]
MKTKLLGPAVIAFGLLVAACGDDSGTKAAPAAAATATTVSTSAAAGGDGYGGSAAGTAAPTTGAPATTVATAASAAASTGTAGAPAVAVADNAKAGAKILVDGQGRTLYLFEKDQGTTSACTGKCAVAWPPLQGTATAGAGIDASKLGSANGQVTYNGHLLYYFAADKAPGDANGIGITSWYPVDPAGNKVDKS